jgi:hypothetical protein
MLELGHGIIGVSTVAENANAPIREILLRALNEPLPVGTNLQDAGKRIDELENVLLRIRFLNKTSALVMERAIRIVIDSFDNIGKDSRELAPKL